MVLLRQRNVHYDESFNEMLAGLTAGRSLDKQIQDCERTGNHGTFALLRHGLLKALGVPEPNPKAEMFMTFGCYIPFWSPFKLRDYVKLLSVLGIEYNWADREICCGAPFMQDGLEFVGLPDYTKQRMLAKGHEFMQSNWDIAREHGQETMLYACSVCATLAKKAFPEQVDRHLWIYEVMLDKLEQMTLEATPTVIGYFEGCHHYWPNNDNLPWQRFRNFAGSIKGLKIVDLPTDVCCKRDTQVAKDILEYARQRDVSTILIEDGD